jgi:aryl-alcohol dehydrogenase-like predicted oxidoreductase
MTFGREIGEADSHRIIDRFVDSGGNFIDTADAYSEGRSEEIVGSWLSKTDRHDTVLATKVRFGSGINRRGLSRKHILHSLDQSLRRLQTDYIDLYQIHMWDYGTPLAETLEALSDAVDAGKVRYLGISNVSGWQLQRSVDLCDARGWPRLVSLQPLYNLLDRDAEWELLEVCANEGIGVIPYSPLRGGWLTGKFRRGARPSGTDSRIAATTLKDPTWTESWQNYDNERTWLILDALIGVAERTGHSPAQVALSWLLGRPGVTAPILGARTVEQLDHNLGALGWELDPADRTRLDEVSARRKPYPYELLADLRDV